VAQWIAHLITDQGVAGSNPARGTTESMEGDRLVEGHRWKRCTAFAAPQRFESATFRRATPGQSFVELWAASSMGEHAWFESRDAHARTDPRSSVDRAPPSEGGGHWFKSSRGYCCPLWRLRGLGTPSGADDAVDSFTEEIGMPVVARVLVDQVQHHQPERHILAPASLVAEHVQ
jgi:hypothetical protein